MAAVGTLFVSPSVMAIACFIDFPRGYYIASVLSLGIFLMNQTGNLSAQMSKLEEAG